MAAQLAELPVVLAGFVGSLLAGLCTGLGALAIFARARWSQRAQMLMLAVAAGVMLGATVFSLIVPALELVGAQRGSEVQAALVVSVGIGLGALGVWLVHAMVPHEA